MTCFQHMFANDADRPYSSLCDCGKRYEEHPIDAAYENERWAEQQMQDLEMEAEYQSHFVDADPAGAEMKQLMEIL